MKQPTLQQIYQMAPAERAKWAAKFNAEQDRKILALAGSSTLGQVLRGVVENDAAAVERALTPKVGDDVWFVVEGQQVAGKVLKVVDGAYKVTDAKMTKVWTLDADAVSKK